MKFIIVFLGLAVIGAMARRPGGGNGRVTKRPGGKVPDEVGPGNEGSDVVDPGNGPACTCSIQVIQSNGQCRRGKVLRNTPGCQCDIQVIGGGGPGVPPVDPPYPTEEPTYPTEEPVFPTEEPVTDEPLPTDEPIAPIDPVDPVDPIDPIDNDKNPVVSPCSIGQPCRKGNKTTGVTGRPKPTLKPRNPGRRPVTRPPVGQGGKKPGNVGRFPDDSIPENGQGCVCSIQIVQGNGMCRQGKVMRSSGGCKCNIQVVMGSGPSIGLQPPTGPVVDPTPCIRESPTEPCRKRNKTSSVVTGKPSRPTPPTGRPSRPVTMPNIASGRPGSVTPKPGQNIPTLNRPVRGRKIEISNSITNNVSQGNQGGQEPEYPEPEYPEEGKKIKGRPNGSRKPKVSG